jgi:hypothetical protein
MIEIYNICFDYIFSNIKRSFHRNETDSRHREFLDVSCVFLKEIQKEFLNIDFIDFS